jgi:hypothetical protein
MGKIYMSLPGYDRVEAPNSSWHQARYEPGHASLRVDARTTARGALPERCTVGGSDVHRTKVNVRWPVPALVWPSTPRSGSGLASLSDRDQPTPQAISVPDGVVLFCEPTGGLQRYWAKRFGSDVH